MRRRKTSATLMLGFFLILGLVFYYMGFLNPVLSHLTLGLDLDGGVHIVLEAEDRADSPVTHDAMETAMEVIRRRVDALGVAEPVLQRLGENRIVVDLPGASPEEAREIIGRTAVLEFQEGDGSLIVTGAHLVRAQAAFDFANRPIVRLQFDSEGARLMEEATARMSLTQDPIYMYLDGDLIMDPPPTVRSTIPDGVAIIEGLAGIQEAQNIAVLLSHGALPVHLEVVEERVVSALLGRESVAQSQAAAVYGVVAVVAFMMVVYRLPGFMANTALVLYMLLLMGILVGINATLTLPGIAGIILSVGMAVDANVIIFERIRAELRLGKSIRAAIEAGFQNAFSAILDANVTTLIAAAALGYWGTGPVRGFAVTLSVGVLASMFTALFVTRFLLRHLVGAGWVRDPRILFGTGEASRA